jgi:hypothetical protein
MRKTPAGEYADHVPGRCGDVRCSWTCKAVNTWQFRQTLHLVTLPQVTVFVLRREHMRHL